MILLRVLLLIAVSVLPVCVTASPQSVTLASGEWQPYQCKSMRHGGFVGHLVKDAFSIEGIRVAMEYFPWKRGYEMARVGELDGTFIWRYSTERARHFYFSEPLVVTDAVMFHRKDLEFDWRDNASLLGYRIGGTLGYHYEFAALPGINIDWVDSDHTNMKKLIHGRIDLFADDRRVGEHLLRTRFPRLQANQITYSVWKEGAPISYHLMLTRAKAENAALLQRFNRGLAKLRASGRYADILAAEARGDYRRKQPPRKVAEPVH